MSKLKIEKGASRVRRVPLKTTIDGTIADDIELMCKRSENETSYVVNHLLRFALSQSEDFQEYKQSLESNPSPTPTRSQPTAATPPARGAEAER